MFTIFGTKRRIRILIAMAIILPILVLSYGYFMNISNRKYVDNYEGDENKGVRDGDILEIGDIAQSISSERPVLTLSETVAQKKYIYDICGHVINDEEPIEYSDIGLSRAEYTHKYSDWSIKSFNARRIVMDKIIEGYCPNHYILQDLDGTIGIFKSNINGQLDIIKQTDIPVDQLPEMLQDEIADGVALDTLEDIENMLEDIDS